jgi:RND family efflux transporter MFP subunit
MIIAATLALTACSKEAPPVAKVERPAFTFVVDESGADSANVYSGEIRARHEAVLSFRIGGKLVERLVDAGAFVKKGQVLARLDAADTGLQESAATAQYRLAEDDLKRHRELREQGFISQSVLDAKETALKAAAAQAGLARNQAAYTTLVSDRAGVVSATLAEVGQVVSAGQPVVRVAQEGEREVAVAIPESRFSSLKVGMPVEVDLSAGGAETKYLTGRLRELSPSADPASRTYPARVVLNKGGEKVALGMTARVRFSAGKKRGGFIVPLTAIFQQGDKSAVWIVAQDRSVALRPVTVAAYRDDGAWISDGITAGERIVSAGVHKLTVGDKIKIIQEDKTQ